MHMHMFLIFEYVRKDIFLLLYQEEAEVEEEEESEEEVEDEQEVSILICKDIFLLVNKLILVGIFHLKIVFPNPHG